MVRRLFPGNFSPAAVATRITCHLSVQQVDFRQPQVQSILRQPAVTNRSSSNQRLQVRSSATKRPSVWKPSKPRRMQERTRSSAPGIIRNPRYKPERFSSFVCHQLRPVYLRTSRITRAGRVIVHLNPHASPHRVHPIVRHGSASRVTRFRRENVFPGLGSPIGEGVKVLLDCRWNLRHFAEASIPESERVTISLEGHLARETRIVVANVPTQHAL